MKQFFRNNSLSIVFFIFFVVSTIGQTITGLKEHNETMKELGGKEVNLSHYLTSGHFIEATFENWESEFLQMALLVVFSIFLYQKGSSESKDIDKEEEVDREPDPNKPGVPWPVIKGGLHLKVYKHSLSLVLFALFLLSFILHWYGSYTNFNEENSLKHLPTESFYQYLGNSKLWFESFQNWQSEFLSIFAIVVLSIFLREKGSAESKPVDAPHSETAK